jgi:hypothetical protein
MKILKVEAELLHADGRTDRRTDRLTDKLKLIVAFRNSANVSKNSFKKMNWVLWTGFICLKNIVINI